MKGVPRKASDNLHARHGVHKVWRRNGLPDTSRTTDQLRNRDADGFNEQRYW